jgi:hypothetical protein
MACPTACAFCDAEGFPTTKCMANRVMRWTCCNIREEGYVQAICIEGGVQASCIKGYVQAICIEGYVQAICIC